MEQDIVVFECLSCLIMESVTSAFTDYNQVVFDNLAQGVVRVGASVTTIVILITLAFRTQFGLENSLSLYGANIMFGTLFRVGIAMGFLASFSLWQGLVLDTIEAFQVAATTASVNFDVDAPGLDQERWTLLYYLEFKMWRPLADLYALVDNATSIWSIGKGATLYIGLTILHLAALINLGILTLMFIEFQAIKYLLGAFGPLIIFAWIFEPTRPAAWTALKLLMQSALTIILASAMVSILGNAFEELASPLDDFGTVDPEELLSYISGGDWAQAMLLLIVVFFLLGILKAAAVFIVFQYGGGSTMRLIGANRQAQAHASRKGGS